MTQLDHPSILTARRGWADDDDDRAVVWVAGDHDVSTRLSLTIAIARAAQRDGGDVLVDVSGLTFLDASTVGAIVGGRTGLARLGQSLHLRGPTPSTRRLLELCGLTDLIQDDAAHPGTGAAALATWVDIERDAAPAVAPTGRQPVTGAALVGAELGEQ